METYNYHYARMRLVDLHTHSTASDGADTPAALVRRAARAGLVAVALTDHDTVSGLPEAQAAGREHGIEVIRGCEVSAASPYGEAHILGLWLPEDVGRLEAVLEDQRQKRTLRNRRILERLADKGIALTYDEVLAEAGGETVGRPHIAAALVRRGYASSVRESFQKWLGRNGAAFVARESMDMQDAVRLLAGLGATVCLAHIRLLPCPDSWVEDTVRALKPCGLTAIEAWHSEYTPADTRFCVDVAARHHLGLTGGSDYHGDAKRGVALGVGRGNLRVTAGALEGLKARRRAAGLEV